MSERRRPGVFGRSVIFMLAISFVMTSFGCAGRDVIYVPDDYAKIQWAIDNASSSDIMSDIIILRNVVYCCIIRAADTAYHVLLTSLSRHFSCFPNSPKSNENYMKIFIWQGKIKEGRGIYMVEQNERERTDEK